MEEQLKKKNPWTNLTEGEMKIATCDVPFFEAMDGAEEYTKKNEKAQLTFSCLPDPFGGNPDSKVYCLNMNPGKPDASFEGVEAYAEATIKNLRLESETCFWAEGILNAEGMEHDGADWTRKYVKNPLLDILGCPPDIFFVEYFPYHSKSGFAFPEDLPSYAFSNDLIRQAMKDGKLIIIMRSEDKWLERIDELADYHNLCVLKNHQSVWVSPGNIVRYKSKEKLSEEEIKEYFKI